MQSIITILGGILLIHSSYANVHRRQQGYQSWTKAPPSYVPDRYMIEFHDTDPSTNETVTPVVMRRDLSSTNATVQIEYDFSDVMNIMSVTVSANDTDTISELSSVANLYPVRVMYSSSAHNGKPFPLRTAPIRRDVTGTATGDTNEGQESNINTTETGDESPSRPLNPARENLVLDMLGVTKLRETLNLTGKGVKIGIVDSGLDYTHPAFGKCFKTAGCRVAYGYDLVGNDYDGITNPVATPDKDPMDECNGHGTHVTGILAGNDGVYQGIAPEATLGIYRIFGCGPTGNSGEDVIMQGMLAAYLDGMHMVSLSVGEPGEWAESPSARLADLLTRLGMPVVAANGNMGGESLFASSNPSTGTSVLSVNSVNPRRYWGNQLNVTSDETVTLMRSIELPPPVPHFVFQDTELVYPVDKDGGHSGCSGFDPTTVQNKIVLLTAQAGCSDDDRAAQALAAGAAGMVLPVANNQTQPNMDGITYPHNLRMASITKSDGDYLVKKLEAGQTVTINSDAEYYSWDNVESEQVSAFSSYGPDPELHIKGEITAPGQFIYSTVPLWAGQYSWASGTSQATPQVSGAVALLRQLKGKLDLSYKTPFLQTATPYCFDGSLCDSVLRQGSGLMNVYAALTTPLVASKSTLELLDTVKGKFTNGVATRSFTIQNTGKTSITLAAKHTGSYSFSNRNPDKSRSPVPRRSDATAQVSLDISTLAIAAGGKVTVTVTITQPDLPDGEYWIYSGYLLFSATDDSGVSLTIPYQGLKGDYSSMPILRTNGGQLPMLVNTSTSEVKSLTDSVVFDMVSSKPGISLIKDHPTSNIRIYAVNVDTGNVWYAHTNGALDYTARNFESYLPNTTFTWSGYGYKSLLKWDLRRVPNGKYQLMLAALRPFGERSNSNDYDSWTSSTFEVRYNA
ncbi:hypothetical protein IWQ62_004364 [Dispira parvispora]|uniref:Uncharacterized protein n=1 Tax=Dispira parvispora TaxID=1520584 RepID=A0A9W8ASM7_9FUNG|nr:hypothetical protein IWQ62_004364 [Dispira parvispora]